MNEKKKARRSSILKPPKPRNPLSDIDMNPPTESTFMRQSRRVSFASNNFIKEFKTDPEKNTIWDTTYEEAINKSDPSTDCAVPENVNNDDFNSTRIEDFDVSMEVMISNSSEESFTSTNIVFGPPSEETMCAPNIHINPVRVEPLPTVQMPIDNSIRVPNLPISQIDAANKENNPALLQTLIIKIPPESIGNVPSTNFCPTVEQTTGTSVHLNQNSLQRVQNQAQVDVMEMCVTTRRKKMHFSDKGHTTDLDLTVATNNYNKVQKTFKQGSKEAEVDLAGFETEITKSIPRNSKILHNYAKQNMPKHKTSNFNANSEDANVEGTQGVFTDAMCRQTIHFHNAPDGGDMEVTRVGCAADQMGAKTSRSSIYFNKNSEDGNMELTDEIPAEVANLQKNRYKGSEMEMTRSGASEEAHHYHSIVTRSKAKRNTIHFKQYSQDGDMDLTVQLPSETRKNAKEQNRHTIHFNAASQEPDMEVTQPYPAASTTKNKKQRNTIHFNKNSQDGDMELTEELSPEMMKKLAAQKSSSRGTIHFNAGTQEADMEVTHPHSGPRNTKGKRQRSTIHFNQNSERAETDFKELPPEKTTSNRRTIHFNAASQEADMEVTQPYPGVPNAKNKKQRNKMHFDRNSQGGDMDLTVQVPPEAGKRTVEQNQSSNRRTIHFNPTSEDADMEVTQPYPGAPNTKNKKSRNTMHFDRNCRDGDMDLTVQVPPESGKRTVEQNSSSNRHTIHFNAASPEADMEVTQPYAGVPNTKNKKPRNTMHFDRNCRDGDMDLTVQVPPENEKKTVEQNSSSNRHTIHFNAASQEADMEVTQPYTGVPSGKNKTQRNTMHFDRNSQDGDMDLTVQVPLEAGKRTVEQIQSSNRCTIHFNSTSQEADMEVTQPYPAASITKSKKQRHTIHFNQNAQDGDMELTEELPTEMKRLAEQKSSNRGTIHFNAATQEADMEVTQPHSDLQNTNSKMQRNTIHFNRSSRDGDMELTYELPPEMAKRAAAQKSSNRTTIHFNSASQEADMEVTQPYSTTSTTKDKKQRNITHFNQNSEGTEIDLTEKIALKMLNKENIHINVGMDVDQPYFELSTTKNKNQRNTIHFDRDTEEADLEFTNEMPPEIVNKAVEEETMKRQTIHFIAASHEADMDVTQACFAPSQIKTKKQRNTIHFNPDTQDGEMELTEEIPPELVKRAMAEKLSSNRKTIYFNAASQEAGMDETQAYCTAPKTANARQRNTIYFNRNRDDGDMELTEELPSEMLRKASSNRQTIHFNVASQDADMEVTQAYCAPATAKSKKQRNTIHFNQNTEDGDMELTEQLPPEVAQIAAQKPASIRQTIHFNAVADEAEMEITRAFFDSPIMKNEKHRNTIHFNQNSEAGQMDLIKELAPGMIDKDLLKSSSNRQTIHFCDASKEAEMEEIQAFESKNSRNTIHFNQGGNDQMNLMQELPQITTGTNQNSNDEKIDLTEGIIQAYSCMSDKNQNTANFNKQLSEISNTQKESTINDNRQIDAEMQKSSSDQRQRHTINFTQNSEKYEIGISNTQTEAIFESNRETIHLENRSEEANMGKNESQTVSVNSQSENKHTEEQKLVSHSIRKTVGNANLTETNKNSQGNTGTEDIDDINLDPTKTTLYVQKELVKEKNQRITICFNKNSEDTADVDLTKSESNQRTIDDKKTSKFACILESVQLENQENAHSNLDKNKEPCRNGYALVLTQNLDSGSAQNLVNGNAEISGIELLENSCTEPIINQTYTRKSVSENRIENEESISHDQLVIEPHLLRGGNNSDNSAFNEDEICQVIRLPGTYNLGLEYNPEVMQKQIYLSPQNIVNQESFNVSKHFISYVDDTEKLINYKIGERLVSEYSKILNEDINLSDLKTTVLCRSSAEKSCSSFYVDLPSACLKSSEEGTQQANNKNEDSFIVINSSSESDSYCENQQKIESKLLVLKGAVMMPPCWAELYQSGSSGDSETFLQTNRNNSFRSLIEMSFHNGATITSESISLIESISDASDDFLAVSFAAREVEKMINKSVQLDADMEKPSGEKGAPSGSKRSRPLAHSIKTKLDNVFPVPERKQILLPAESEICPLKDYKQFESIIKWHKPPCREAEPVVSKQMTLEEKIKQLSEDTMWDIISINNEEFSFTFMFGSIEFRLILDRVTENVKSVEFFTRFVESESHPSARFVHSLLKRKLLQKNIRSACGQMYTIFTFLDYITMVGQQMLDILEEFDCLEVQYGVVLDSDLNARCRFVNKFLRVVFETSVNIEMLDSAPDAQITVRSIVGNVRAAEIKRLAKGCSQGIPFIRAFVLSVHEYLRLLQSSKQNKTKKTS